MSEPKYCTDCEHYIDAGIGQIYTQCRLTLQPSLVKRGEWVRSPQYQTIFCNDLRSNPTLCSPEALWFSPKPTTATA